MIEDKKISRLTSSRLSRVLVCAVFIPAIIACGSGLPELRPGLLKQPTKTETHGRIIEKRFRFSNGPKTIFYGILEVDGKPIRIPSGSVRHTTYCEVDGIDAVGFTVRGNLDVAGIYILQVDGDDIIFERICNYGMLGIWKGPVFNACEISWDAKQKKRVPTPPFQPKSQDQ